jgi:hypothetical protein
VIEDPDPCTTAFNDCLRRLSLSFNTCGLNCMKQFHTPPVVNLEKTLECLDLCEAIANLTRQACVDDLRACRNAHSQPPLPRKRFSPEQKRRIAEASTIAEKTSTLLGFEALALGTLGGILYAPCDLAAGVAWTGAAAFFMILKIELSSASERDPIDPNFGQIADPEPPRPPSIAAERDTAITQEVADAINRLLLHEARVIGITRAFVASINRSQGAAAAHDDAAEIRQLSAARRHARSLGNLIPRTRGLSSKVISGLRTGGAEFTISVEDAMSLLGTVLREDVPDEYRELFTTFGIVADTIEVELRRQIIGFVDFTTRPATFPDALLSSP